MVTWIIERLLTGLERRLGAKVDHLRLVAANSRSAFCKVLGKLDQRIRLALEFTRAVLHNTDEQSRLRAELGERSLVELSLAMASARVFPTLKRSLGCSTHCQRLALLMPHQSGASSS